MTNTFEKYEEIRGIKPGSKVYAKLNGDAPNKYYKDELPVIPSRTELILEFGCEHGCYAVACVDGVFHKVDIPVAFWHLIEITEQTGGGFLTVVNP